jgi:hypothetical protein
MLKSEVVVVERLLAKESKGEDYVVQVKLASHNL